MSHRLIVSAGGLPREFVLVDRLVVGRDPMCDVSDQDPLLSRRHAEFAETSSGVVVRDLGSRNGILINGVKQPQALLTSGDVVQIGHLQVRVVEQAGPFRVETPPPPVPPTRVPVRAATSSRPASSAAAVGSDQADIQTVLTPQPGPPLPGHPASASSVAPPDAPTIVMSGPEDASPEARAAAERLAEEEANNVRNHAPEATDVFATTALRGGRWFAIVEYLLPGADGPERVRQFAVATPSGVARLTCSARAADFARFDVVLASAAPMKGSGTSP